MNAPVPAVHIRTATPEDASTLAALNATVQSLHARLVPELFKPVGADTYDEQTMQRIVAQQDTIMLVACVNGRPAGYAYAEVRRRPETPHARGSSEVYLHHISVEDSFRRMGVGSALLEAVGAAGRALGIVRMATEAWIANQPALAFLQAHAPPAGGACKVSNRSGCKVRAIRDFTNTPRCRPRPIASCTGRMSL